jgi:hypothetical protein
MPRTHFTQGISKNFSKLTGSEETGVLLIILITLCSSGGSTMFANAARVGSCTRTYIGSLRLANWVGTIERFLQLEQWAKDTIHSKGHTQADLTVVDKYIPMLISRFKKTLERRKGLGTKLVKLHMLMHYVEYHRKYGRNDNYNSAYGETRHKLFCKKPGKQTQRRKETFDKEVSNRGTESIIVQLALSSLQTNCEHPPIQQVQVEVAPPEPNKAVQGRLYHIFHDKVKKPLRSKCFQPLQHAGTHPSAQEAVEYLQNSLNTVLANTPDVMTYHTLKQGNEIYHCCPSYNGDPWYDWAMINHPSPAGGLNHDADTAGRNPTPITVQILLLFQQVHPYTTSTKLFDDCDVAVPGEYVVYQRLDGREMHCPTHPESTMLFYAKLDPTLRCAPIGMIAGPITVYRDVDFADKKKLHIIQFTDWYCVIRPRTTWALQFFHRAENDETGDILDATYEGTSSSESEGEQEEEDEQERDTNTDSSN